MSQQDETVPAYLVVYHVKENVHTFTPRYTYGGKIFLKSRVNQLDIYNFLARETIQSVYNASFSISETTDDSTLQEFVHVFEFKILYILEKLYQATYFNERGEFIAFGTFINQLEKKCRVNRLDERGEWTVENFKTYRKKMKRFNQCETIDAPSSLVYLASTVCKNQLILARTDALKLISILPSRTIAQIASRRPNIKPYTELENNHYKDETLVKLSENEIRETLKNAFIESLFDTHVPYFNNHFNFAYFECGVSARGRFGIFDSYYGKCCGGYFRATPLTKEMVESFYEIRELLSPYLNFAKIIHYNEDDLWKNYSNDVAKNN